MNMQMKLPLDEQGEINTRFTSVTVESPTLDSAIDTLCNLVRLQRQVAEAIQYTGGTHTFDDVVQGILASRFRFIHMTQSFYLLEKMLYPQTTHLHVFLAGGNLDELLANQDKLVAIAEAEGCEAITMSGRSGWLKKLPEYGWDKGAVSMIRRL